MATIEDNYSADYSTYYLDFASSIEATPTATVTSRTDSIQALRDAAKRLAKDRGITITAARKLLRAKASLRTRYMGATGAADWELRTTDAARSAAVMGTSGTGFVNDGSAYDSILGGLGLADGLFSDLIDRAIRNNWTPEQFRAQLLDSNQFNAMFPGIKRPDGSLRMTALEYRQLADSFTAVAKEFGVTMSGERVGYLIEGAVSPQEFYQRVSVFEKVKANPDLMDTFNEQLGQFGLKPLDQQDWFRFLAGVGSKDYYDVYEAAQLQSSGLNIGSVEAAGVARNIGETGAPLDIQGLVAEARTMLADIGPELLREGITDADLVSMAAGYDPNGLEPKLRTIIENRRATGAFVMGSRPTNSGSGTTVFTPEEAASY